MINKREGGRPQFDDPLPGEKPAAMLRDDHAATAAEDDAARRAEDERAEGLQSGKAAELLRERTPTVPSTPTPPSDPLTEALDGVADGDSARAAKALFDPTLKRMAVLLDTLINMTGNGDFALWAPLNLMDATLKGYDWAKNPKPSSLKLVALISQTLTHYAGKLDEWRRTFEAVEEGGTIPPLPVLTNEEILEMYDIVDILYKDKPNG